LAGQLPSPKSDNCCQPKKTNQEAPLAKFDYRKAADVPSSGKQYPTITPPKPQIKINA
jgi:hypothetical protein